MFIQWFSFNARSHITPKSKLSHCSLWKWLVLNKIIHYPSHCPIGLRTSFCCFLRNPIYSQLSRYSHPNFTLFTLKFHPVHTQLSPYSHSTFTLFTPKFHPIHTHISPYSHSNFTLFTVKLHPILTQISPFSHPKFTLFTVNFHPIHTQITP